MRKMRFLNNKKNKGIVLLAVLWVTMALAAIAISISHLTRLQIKSNIHQSTLTDRKSLAASAMRLALDWMIHNKIVTDRRIYFEVVFNNQNVSVSVTPANGLIDLNNAPVALISSLLETSLGMHKSDAKVLASNIDVYRKRLDTTSIPLAITSIDQLAEIPGLDLMKIEKLRNSVTVHYRGDGKINPLSATVPVLKAITHGNEAQVQNIINRQANALGLETMSIEPSWIEFNPASVIYISAHKSAEVGKRNLHWIVGLWPNVIDGTPWTVLSANTH